MMSTENKNNTNNNSNEANNNQPEMQQPQANETTQQPVQQQAPEKEKRNWKKIGLNILKGLGVAAVAAGAGLGGYVLGSHKDNGSDSDQCAAATTDTVQSNTEDTTI